MAWVPPAAPDPPLADHEIGDGADIGQSGDEQQPGQGHAPGRPPHDHAKGDGNGQKGVESSQQDG